MKLSLLLAGLTKSPLTDCEIIGLHNDSRKILPGFLFFAYKGAVADGRLYIAEVFEKGASAVVYDPDSLPSSHIALHHTFCIPVTNLSLHLATIANRFYDYPTRALTVTGVTGTNGKTTIAYLLAQAHGLLGHSAAYIGTLGQGEVSQLQLQANTTPDALKLQQLFDTYRKNQIQQVCMEVSSHALSQGRVEGVAFSQAIYTNLTHDHLDFHKTMSDYALAKSRLFAWPTLKCAIINHDDSYASFMIDKLPKSCQKLTYGLREQGDIRALQWHSSMQGSDIEISSPWGTHALNVNMLGAFNVYNSLAVFASLMSSGYSVSQVIELMPKLHASLGRMEVVAQAPCVVVDYAHTPDALENVLLTLQQLKQGRLLVVFGCGGDRDKSKRPMMGRIASLYADEVIITSDNPRHEVPRAIMDDIEAGLLPKTRAMKIVDRKDAIQHALNLSNPEDIVLIAGKGHEAYQQIGDEKLDFSDRVVVCELMTAIT